MPSRRPRKPGSPLDSEQRRLKEQEQAILQQEAKLRKLLEQAPRLKQEKQRRELEERRRLAVTTTARASIAGVLRDSRFGDEEVPHLRNRRVLRSERRKALVWFFLLCAILLLFLVILLGTIPS